MSNAQAKCCLSRQSVANAPEYGTVAVMPELPEVETVCQGLRSLLPLPLRIIDVSVRNHHLRQPIPADLAQRCRGHLLQRIERRAKYLLWTGSHGCLLNHLGMTGSWRVVAPNESLAIHDHVELTCEDGLRLAYRDPRRFGLLTWHPSGTTIARLEHLGPEPLGSDFTPTYLWRACRQRSAPIKTVIMDQRVVVGVGNIYAAEALFTAGIRPQVPSKRLGRERIRRLCESIRDTLSNAIRAGGSTIRDFRQAGGSQGYFQHTFAVYGRAGDACRVCGSSIRQDILGGRSSAWCPRCQRW